MRRRPAGRRELRGCADKAIAGPPENRGHLPATASPDLGTRVDALRAFLRSCFDVAPTPVEFERMLAFNTQVPRHVLTASPWMRNRSTAPQKSQCSSRMGRRNSCAPSRASATSPSTTGRCRIAHLGDFDALCVHLLLLKISAGRGRAPRRTAFRRLAYLPQKVSSWSGSEENSHTSTILPLLSLSRSMPACESFASSRSPENSISMATRSPLAM